MRRLFGKIKRGVTRAGHKLEDCQTRMAFAEGGVSEPEVLQEDASTEEHEPAKLLVMGKESTFSQDIIDYALEMAERLSYDILALNTAPLSCHTFKMFSSSHSKVCEDFKQLSNKNIRRFREAAEAQGINFEHVVMFNEAETALASITENDKSISFVISETVEDRDTHRIEEGERIRPSLYVYSVV